MLHTVGTLLVDGHYSSGGAGPGQLTLCRERRKSDLIIAVLKKHFANGQARCPTTTEVQIKINK